MINNWTRIVPTSEDGAPDSKDHVDLLLPLPPLPNHLHPLIYYYYSKLSIRVTQIYNLYMERIIIYIWKG